MRPGKNTFNIILASCLLIAVGYSCSTKKNTFTRRVYHNLTAHYNAYFNGKEALKEGVAELSKINKDNYNKVLPVFPLGTKADAQSVYSFLDRAIEKGSIVVHRHSIFIKNQEHVKWIDDAYLLIGRSYYYKQEYDLAYQTFNFIIGRYKNNAIVYNAIIWKARVLTEQDRLDEAEALLQSVQKKIEKNKAFHSAEKLYPLVYADILLKKEDYSGAVEYLQQGIRLNKSRKERVRLYFILAQACQKSGSVQKATEYYKKVLGMNPVYDMEFAAKISLAKNYDITQGSSKDIKKLMTRMLRDSKNKEFQDQIHFALAEIFFKENDIESAIKHLKLSARTSVSNDYQKAVSYLRLADLYFEDQDYEEAQQFYDSTVMFLPKDYPNFTTINAKKNTLNELVKNLKIIQLEDSLQMLARLPESERNQKIDDIIADIIKKEQEAKQAEYDRMNELANQQQINQNNNAVSGSWYFYNPSAMSFGYSEFVKKWGNRKYEDLWRLSDKVMMDFDFDAPGDEDDSSSTQDIVENDPKSRQTYISQLPLTPGAVDTSNQKIAEALHNVGIIYKESLEDDDKAIKSFQNLEKRFPESKHTLPAYYHLYKIYAEKDDPAHSDYYKNLILTKYPDSEYAMIIKDPEYYKKIEEQQNILESFYKATYLAYINADYETVINNADSAKRTFKDKELIPKFEMLKALSIGKTQPVDKFSDALKYVISKYPYSDVKTEAQNILDALGRVKGIISDNETVKADTNIKENNLLYKFDPGAFHFYIVVMDARQININSLKNLYSNHNTTYFSNNKLNVNSLFLNDTEEVINVGRFDNMQKAMDYLLSVENNNEIMGSLSQASAKQFVVSSNNYPVFYQNKNVEKYLEFFNKYYTKQ